MVIFLQQFDHGAHRGRLARAWATRQNRDFASDGGAHGLLLLIAQARCGSIGDDHAELVESGLEINLAEIAEAREPGIEDGVQAFRNVNLALIERREVNGGLLFQG